MMTDNRRPFVSIWARPPFQLEHLLVKLIRKSACPWLELLGDEFLKNGGKSTFRSDALAASCLIDKRNDADRGKASN